MDGFVALDARFRLIHMNDEARAMFGRNAADLLGRPVWDALPPPLDQSLRLACEMAMGEQKSVSIQLVDATNDRHIDCRIHPSGEGLVLGFRDPRPAQRAEQEGLRDANRLAWAQKLAQVGSLEWDIASSQVVMSAELCHLYGLPAEKQESTFDAYLALVYPDDRASMAQHLQQARSDHQPFEFEGRFLHPDGSMRTLLNRGQVSVDGHGRAVNVLLVCQDITAGKRAQQVVMGQHDILVGIAAQRPLAESLARIARLHEALNPGALCSILLIDDAGTRVLCGAAPSLPAAYSAKLDGLEIGNQHGSCGTAAWRRERVVVENIETHPYWANYKSLALAHGLRACWSTPILGSDGRVLGTFAVYFREPRHPRQDELDSIDQMVPIAGVAIESARLIERLRVRDSFFEMSLELFCIIDPATGRLVQFNPSLERITGYDANELAGLGYRELFPVEHGADGGHLAAPLGGVAFSIREFVTRCACKDGSERVLEWVSFAAPDGLVYAVARDITARREMEAKLAYASTHDALTGLRHYLLFERDLVNRMHESPARTSVLVIGLDRFQMVNASIGHPAADEVLKRVATRLQLALPEQAQMARIAGDQFVVAVAGIEPSGARELGDRLRVAVAKPLEGRNYRLVLSASVGVSHYPQHGRTADDLLRRADEAMNQAKRNGRDQLAELSVEQMVELDDRVTLGSRLRDAIGHGEFELYYQPQHRANGYGLVGFEALLRWNCTPFGALPPARFIPLAEAMGLMPEVGVWVLDHACHQARAWFDLGHRDFIMAVNVSAQQLVRPGLAESVEEILHRHGLPAAMLEIEMTESSLMKNVSRTQDTLARLRALGVRLSLDDLGTGYSSLSYLRQFPVNKLKVDQSFVSGLPMDTKNAAIIGTIVALGHQLEMQVAVEGVETQAQAALLARLGCDVLQGHYLAPALSARDAQAYFDHIHYGAA
ncbi:EAL domain-containing protein [Dyella solisilvae]|uniref:EAL domain-containing protein n=1 Tax=Dyella solisilvae TaxID=1920168 RepID=A0A370K5G6_9GAMM|nr:EAL domain-containing protein [Dyella solisilvae]RDI97687.1 EAL domain-containing protein [Dyella solisilvae]